MGRLPAYVLTCEMVKMFGSSFKKPGGENEGTIHLSGYLRSGRDTAALLKASLETTVKLP